MAKSLRVFKELAVLSFLLITQLYELEASDSGNETARLLNTFEWIRYDKVIENRHRLTPLSNQGTTPQYICRWFHLNNWVPGKFWMDGDLLRCRVPVDMTEHRPTDFEVLYTPIDSVAWERWANVIPDNAVSVGFDRSNRQETYICKAVHLSLWVIGKLSGAKCWIPYGGSEYNATSGFDILVVTNVGKELSKPLYKVGI